MCIESMDVFLMRVDMAAVDARVVNPLSETMHSTIVLLSHYPDQNLA